MDELGTPRSAISFNALLSACNQSRLFDKVPQLFDEMSARYEIHPDKVSYGNLVKAYCGMGSPELAMQTVEGMAEKGVEITAVTYTTILDLYYKKGMAEEAQGVWQEMVKKGCFDTAAYNVRIMHGGGCEPEKIKALIEEMGAVGLKPDATSYNWLMTCYCKLGMMDEAKKVFKDLEGNGCVPNAASFRTLVYHLCKKGRFVQGYEVFKESVGMNKIPDSETLKILLEGLVESRRRREAVGIIRTLKKKFPAGSLRWLHKFEVDTGLASVAHLQDAT